MSETTTDSATVRDALARHYRAHGLPPDGGVSDPWFRVRVGAVSFRLPNPPARRRALFFHDVNHVATGYDTTFGEGEVAIAAFEVGAGCAHFAIVWFINLSMMAIGLVLSPHMVAQAFVRGRHSVSIYRETTSPEELAAIPVLTLRQRLGLDRPTPAASRADYLAFAVWGAVAVAVLLAPVVLTLGVAWFALLAASPRR